MSDPSKSRIAIKLGGPSTSTSTSRPSPRGAVPPSSLGKRARQTTSATAALGDESDSDSDSDSEHHHHHHQHQAITAFGQDGAETDRTDNPPKKQYVIAKQPNRDWRSEMKAQRRSRNPLPEEAQQKQPPHPPDQDENLQWGLTLPPDKKAEAHHDDDIQSGSLAQNQNQIQTQAPYSLPQPAACSPDTRPRTTTDDDDEALAALLGNNKPRGPEKRIPAPSEDEVYKRDAAGAGAVSTLEDYEAMPVEEFGAALLRGMGWNGDPTGPKVKEVRRRPNRLGLGAKELKDAEDLGGWNQTGQKARPTTRPRLADYRREESRRKEERSREDSYKREREREREWDRDRRTDSDRDRDRHSRYKEERRHRHRNTDGYRDSHSDRRR
ncbi:hypothetical protein E4U43_007241 [Claviceps pusilla]|uniref:Pre-mRNA-splicing factor n=1 Tax=Claviceps pusilla TaxID=123648 RepID=A0A9P7NCW2_9HYPO|nr:hypothetical protein E4U43_007241 [Claviceps pusilla]